MINWRPHHLLREFSSVYKPPQTDAGIKTAHNELYMDYKKRRTEHAPILIDRVVVEQVESLKFQQTNMVQAHQDSREEGTTKPITPQETEKIWHGSSDPQILKSFYSCVIESILTGCITAWYGNCLASDRKVLQRVMHTAQYITGVKLPAIQNLQSQSNVI